MTEFEITINGKTESVKTKHIVNGNFLVRQNKTNNLFRVKYIETLFADDKKTYRIKSFYPSSPFACAAAIDQQVVRVG